MHTPSARTERITRRLRQIGKMLRRLGIVPVTVEGDHPELPADKGVILASTHVAAVDPVYLEACSPRPLLFLASLRVFSSPLWGPYVSAAGHLPVDSQFPELYPVAARGALEYLRAGKAVAIFPEGAYPSRPGSLLELQPGAGWLARVSGAPILPVAIHGTRGVFPWYRFLNRVDWQLPRYKWVRWLQFLKWVPCRRPVRIVVGRLIFSDGKSTRELTEELSHALATLAGVPTTPANS